MTDHSQLDNQTMVQFSRIQVPCGSVVLIIPKYRGKSLLLDCKSSTAAHVHLITNPSLDTAGRHESVTTFGKSTKDSWERSHRCGGSISIKSRHRPQRQNCSSPAVTVLERETGHYSALRLHRVAQPKPKPKTKTAAATQRQFPALFTPPPQHSGSQ
jgi:hypothetical protein